jgi:hypothetical protein
VYNLQLLNDPLTIYNPANKEIKIPANKKIEIIYSIQKTNYVKDYQCATYFNGEHESKNKTTRRLTTTSTEFMGCAKGRVHHNNQE